MFYLKRGALSKENSTQGIYTINFLVLIWKAIIKKRKKMDPFLNNLDIG